MTSPKKLLAAGLLACLAVATHTARAAEPQAPNRPSRDRRPPPRPGRPQCPPWGRAPYKTLAGDLSALAKRPECV